jgi:hypothetical protein
MYFGLKISSLIVTQNSYREVGNSSFYSALKLALTKKSGKFSK